MRLSGVWEGCIPHFVFGTELYRKMFWILGAEERLDGMGGLGKRKMPTEGLVCCVVGAGMRTANSLNMSF